MKFISLVCFAAAAFGAAPTLDIKVDQVGYLTREAKIALVSSKTPATQFTLNQSRDGKVVITGTLSAPVDDYNSGDRVQTADFSTWRTSGIYYIDVPGVGRSWNFEIGPDVYAKSWRLATRSFFGERCGTAVDLGPEFPGFRHDACHLQSAYHPSTGKTGSRVPTGGWHDGSDYGRYMVDSGVATGILLWTYEMYPARVGKAALNLPESGNGVPDILNEARWNLDWMLSMQAEDGGIWHKQTGEAPAGLVMPDQDKPISYVVGLGKEPFEDSCATGDFAAVMAVAGRVYQPFNPAFGNRGLQAAARAWGWLDKNPNVTFRNPAGISTSEYGDSHCEDEHLWAAAELFRATGQKQYERYFLDHYTAFRRPSDEAEPPSWHNVAPLAFWTYAQAKGADPTAVNLIRREVIGIADEIVKRSANNGYLIGLTDRDYVQGSNGILAGYGMQLLIADAIAPNPRYRQMALEDLHYLLGRNTFSQSFVTRVGENPPQHPHHPPSAADRNPQPWPGLLVGGPNHAPQDPKMRELPADLPPAKMYVDDQNATSANGVSIGWNAPLVFLLAGAMDGPAAAVNPTAQPQKKSRKRF